MRRPSKPTALVLVLAACTLANGSEPVNTPGFGAPVSVAVGPNVAVVITWSPGTTDSITFTATTAGVQVASLSGVKPFAGVDTLVLGVRPVPGVTAAWDIAADYWWTDRGVSVNGTAVLGTVQYTEPQPAGVEPGFDSLPPPNTTTLGSVIVEDIWPDSATILVGVEAVQFCRLLLMSDGFWTLGEIGPAVAPPVCAAEVNVRNARGAVPAADLWMMLVARRPPLSDGSVG